MSPIQYVHYAFSSGGLPPSVAETHAAFARRELSRLLDLALPNVHVSHKKRLPEDAPFQLTCYTGKSSTDAAAMAVAAKRVLPVLRRAYQSVDRAPTVLTAWTPGDEPARDDDALQLLADGFTVPADEERLGWLSRRSLLPLAADNTRELAAALLASRRAEMASLFAKVGVAK